MAFHVRDVETDRLVRELAERRGIGLTEAVREAASEALAKEERYRADATRDFRDRLKEFFARVDALPRVGAVPDKSFYDDLWGEDDR